MTKDQLDTIAQQVGVTVTRARSFTTAARSLAHSLLTCDNLSLQLGPSVSRPRYYDFSSIGVRSLKQANEWIENEAKRTDLYGEVRTRHT
jgi:hypothetical protein